VIVNCSRAASIPLSSSEGTFLRAFGRAMLTMPPALAADVLRERGLSLSDSVDLVVGGARAAPRSPAHSRSAGESRPGPSGARLRRELLSTEPSDGGPRATRLSLPVQESVSCKCHRLSAVALKAGCGARGLAALSGGSSGWVAGSPSENGSAPLAVLSMPLSVMHCRTAS
jgi:hypothetical protein